ncbi:MAG: efflux RND transporter permease subunit [Deltaproteobacteria bacterium]|nr:efflux RND transporter permease subunit [Deltaproteobacteria bacterium]
MSAMIAFFVKRPLLVNLTMVFVVITGLMATGVMKFEVMPRVDLGLINITTARPGSGPEDVELSITVPLEEEILKVDGLDKVTSNSMEGMSVITVVLHPDVEDKNIIIADIHKAVDRAVSRLPADLPEKPLVEQASTLKLPVLELHVTGSVPENVLRTTARQLADGLREVDGVAGVDKIGFREQEVRVLLEPGKLQHLGLRYQEIVEAVKRRNVRDSGGSIESFVAEKEVLTVGQFSYPREVEEVIVRSAGPGNEVRVRDIATVYLDYEDWQVQSRIEGLTSIALLARKKAESDSLKTTDRVWAFVESERQALPPGVRLVAVNDPARFTRYMLKTMNSNALLGFTLVFLVLCAFFHWRLALWVSAGLPVAILITFSLMPFFGLGINLITLPALILMMGMLVDDAVVTSESISRMREQGLDPVNASIKGTARVAMPVLVSTLTTILAFAPIGFMGGWEGNFLWAMPVMVGLSLGASLLECKFMLPAHLAHCRPGAWQIKGWFVRVQDAYDIFINNVIDYRYRAVCLFVAGFVCLLIVGKFFLPFNLYPETDIDTFYIKVELPEGASFSHTGNKLQELETLTRSLIPPEDLLNIVITVGMHDTDPYGATDGHNPAWGLLSVYMLPQGQRTINSMNLMARLRRDVQALHGFRSIVVEPLKDTPVQGKPVELEVVGADEQRLAVAEAISGFLQRHAGVTDVWSSYKPGKEVVELKLNHTLMASRGITVADVTQAVRIAFDGLVVDKLQTVDEEIEYRLQFSREEKSRMQTLHNLAIMNPDGKPVYLRGIVDFTMHPGEASIKRYFGQRTVTVFSEIDRNVVSVQKINDEITAFVKEQDLLRMYPGVRLKYGGELEQQKDAIGNIRLAFLICVVSIFFVLVLLFNSLTQPFLIMLVVPFGLTGVIVGFVLQGLPLSLIALIGVLGLIGVLVNDSLVMIDALNRIKRESGRALLHNFEIARGAGQRLRPIVINSLTTAAALFPTAYGIAGSNTFIMPMVMAMAWGVLFGTTVTLILLPALYGIEQDMRVLVGKKNQKTINGIRC